jgi:hypothetical protein
MDTIIAFSIAFAVTAFFVRRDRARAARPKSPGKQV